MTEMTLVCRSQIREKGVQREPNLFKNVSLTLLLICLKIHKQKTTHCNILRPDLCNFHDVNKRWLWSVGLRACVDSK